jgi:hypothetical protein
MTPKEKAFELYNKFYMAIPSDEMGLSDEASRQCALIAVDEILNTIMSVYQPETKLFWLEVKKEIEAL